MLPHVIEIVLSGEGGVGVVAAEGGEILIEQLDQLVAWQVFGQAGEAAQV